jgi:agmatine deiminase
MKSSPIADGLSLPSRYARHARSYIAWPREDDRYSLERARQEHAVIAQAIAAFEPVTLVAHPNDAADVASYLELGDSISLLEVPLDGAWIRDNGPIFVSDRRGGVALVNFRFNGWGNRYGHALDDRIPERIAASLEMRRYDAPFVLEGGSISADGDGTLITTEQCLLHPNRNPHWSREQIEQGLRDYLGIEKVIWLKGGLVEDQGTDGHSDNVVQFLEPGRVLLQTVADPENPNYAGCLENLRRLQAARDAHGRQLEIVCLDLLPYTEPILNPSFPELGRTRYPVPYLNYYPVNEALIVPMLGGPDDEKARLVLQQLHPDHEIVGVPSTALAVDGGGVGCITQQQPLGQPLS